jgi:hypothetical protein
MFWTFILFRRFSRKCIRWTKFHSVQNLLSNQKLSVIKSCKSGNFVCPNDCWNSNETRVCIDFEIRNKKYNFDLITLRICISWGITLWYFSVEIYIQLKTIKNENRNCKTVRTFQSSEGFLFIGLSTEFVLKSGVSVSSQKLSLICRLFADSFQPNWLTSLIQWKPAVHPTTFQQSGSLSKCLKDWCTSNLVRKGLW